MARQANPVPNRILTTTLPKPLSDRLDLFLWSEVEGRVPKGAYQQFFVECIRRYFETRELDLAPYLGSNPGELIISGTDHTLSRLINHLKKGDSHGKQVEVQSPDGAHTLPQDLGDDLSGGQ